MYIYLIFVWDQLAVSINNVQQIFNINDCAIKIKSKR